MCVTLLISIVLGANLTVRSHLVLRTLVLSPLILTILANRLTLKLTYGEGFRLN
jgi:hypothetical protein